jgi:thioredoxin-related protein
MQKYLFIISLSLISKISFSQEIVPPSLVKWYTLEEAMKLAESNPRPIMLDIYTDWCSWCKFMMKTTFANKGIADYINNNYYPARFDAETFDTITFKGQKYFNRKIGNRPSHDLASLLLDGNLSYPSLVFFDLEKNKTIIPGYKEAKDIEPILVYFAENVNKSASLDDFYLNFMYSFPSAFTADHSIFKIDQKLKPDTLGKISWTAPEMLANLQKKKARQVVLFFYTDWNISSKVLERSTFRDKGLADKINSTYYPIKINAASNDTINFLGKIYTGTEPGRPNQLSYAFLNNNFQMPAIVILDEKNAIKGMINGFWPKKYMIPLLDYFYGNSNAKMSFEEYYKTHPTN